LYLLLAVVAAAAGMLSFAALRDLAQLCGFAPVLAWLLPVVIDAGAAAGSLVWLGSTAAGPARRFARRLALGLLGLSVAANALGHGLAAYALAPPWWVVVLLSGIAPAVLGAMVHLAVLVGRPNQPLPDRTPGDVAPTTAPPQPEEPAQTGDGFPWTWDPAPAPTAWPPASAGPTDDERDIDPAQTARAQASAVPDDAERVAALIAAGAGRRRLSRELGVTEYEARRLLEHARPPASTPTDHTTASKIAAPAPATTSSGALS
jgi:hypothetical protein